MNSLVQDSRVLVTGGAGYIGSHVVLRLLESGSHVFVLDNLSTGRRELVPHEVDLVVGDVGDSAVVQSLLSDNGIEHVIHMAGSIVVSESVADPLGYYSNNTLNSWNLISACVKAGVGRFLFSSSAAVYGTPEYSPVSEAAAVSPESPYGSSKLMTEWMLRDVAAVSSMRCAALRYFNVAGADPKGRAGQATLNATHLIKVACEAAVGIRDHVEIFGTNYDTPDGTGIRDYIHVSDLADAHVAVLGHLGEFNKDLLTLNCGYGHGHSVREILAAMQRILGRTLEIRETSRRPGDVSRLVADVTRLHQQLGWRPRHDNLEDIIATALAWEQKLQDAVCQIKC